MTRQFKRSFDEQSLNELGKATRLCRREREATPYRLMLTLIESFTIGTLDLIADIQRSFNVLCNRQIQYKPFHNQLSKRGFAGFVRLVLNRLPNDLTCNVLRFTADSPFAHFTHIRIQDGTSFALKSSLASTFRGRFTTISPAAVELHVDLDLMSESANQIVLSEDSAAERQFLPAPEELTGALLLGDRGYFWKGYLQGVDRAGGFFIVRGRADLNPLIIKAIDPNGCEVKRFREQRLKAVRNRLSKYKHLDLRVCFGPKGKEFQCRLIVHPNLRGDNNPRYLVTNLDREEFSPEQISDGYRLRWQIELLFKKWKSHANLHAFDTANANVAEDLIWASLYAAVVKRYCAPITQRITQVAMSTRTIAKYIRHILGDILHDLMHRPGHVQSSVEWAIDYLSTNARRAHPDRDRKKGRLKLGLEHVNTDA